MLGATLASGKKGDRRTITAIPNLNELECPSEQLGPFNIVGGSGNALRNLALTVLALVWHDRHPRALCAVLRLLRMPRHPSS